MKKDHTKDNIKDEFISTLTHEIRTPLTSIKGFSKTMLESWDDLNDNQKKKFLKIIEEQSQRLINLVENVLNVAKLNSADDIVLKEINLAQATKEAAELNKINNKDKRIIIKCANVPKSLTDKDKLEQILVNVIENACKYSSEKDDIEININNKGSYNIISVKNYGSFIEKKHIKHIFEKFYRANNYLTSKTQGSGLGLYIAKTLIEQLKGKIEAISDDKPVPFCEFLIYVPVFELETITQAVTKGGVKSKAKGVAQHKVETAKRGKVQNTKTKAATEGGVEDKVRNTKTKALKHV